MVEVVGLVNCANDETLGVVGADCFDNPTGLVLEVVFLIQEHQVDLDIPYIPKKRPYLHLLES